MAVPTKITLTGVSENLDAGFTKVNLIIDAMLTGDGTAGRILRVSRLTIENSAGSKIKCTLSDIYNGDTIAAEDGIEKSGGTLYELDATGSKIHLPSTGITGDATHALMANCVDNGSGNIFYINPTIVSAGITIEFQLNDSTAYDLTGAVDTGTIVVDIIYLTL